MCAYSIDLLFVLINWQPIPSVSEVLPPLHCVECGHENKLLTSLRIALLGRLVGLITSIVLSIRFCEILMPSVSIS